MDLSDYYNKTLPSYAPVGYDEWLKKQNQKNSTTNKQTSSTNNKSTSTNKTTSSNNTESSSKKPSVVASTQSVINSMLNSGSGIVPTTQNVLSNGLFNASLDASAAAKDTANKVAENKKETQTVVTGGIPIAGFSPILDQVASKTAEEGKTIADLVVNTPTVNTPTVNTNSVVAGAAIPLIPTTPDVPTTPIIPTQTPTISNVYTQTPTVTQNKSTGVSPSDFGLDLSGGITGFDYKDFAASDEYKKAMEYTNLLLSQLSTGRTSYTDQITALMNEYKNRDKFSYDMNSDPLFQQMLASSMNSGRMAMQDTIGQAAALTGGYGNTYGQAVGNSAYNQYISDSYDSLPDYYNMALDAYNMEGDQMLNELSLLRDADNEEYSRLLNSYKTNLDSANTMYDREYTEYLNGRNAAEKDYWNTLGFNYDAYMDALNQSNIDRNFNYNAAQDALAQQNWEKNFNYNASQDALAQENWEKNFNYNVEQDKATGGTAVPELTTTEINVLKEIGAKYGNGETAQNMANSFLEGIGKNPDATEDTEAFFGAVDSFLSEGMNGSIYDTIYGTDTSQSAQNKYWNEYLKKINK